MEVIASDYCIIENCRVWFRVGLSQKSGWSSLETLCILYVTRRHDSISYSIPVGRGNAILGSKPVIRFGVNRVIEHCGVVLWRVCGARGSIDRVVGLDRCVLLTLISRDDSRDNGLSSAAKCARSRTSCGRFY